MIVALALAVAYMALAAVLAVRTTPNVAASTVPLTEFGQRLWRMRRAMDGLLDQVRDAFLPLAAAAAKVVLAFQELEERHGVLQERRDAWR